MKPKPCDCYLRRQAKRAANAALTQWYHRVRDVSTSWARAIVIGDLLGAYQYCTQPQWLDQRRVDWASPIITIAIG